MVEEKIKPEGNIPYDEYVLLPSVRNIHSRLGKGYFGRKTWNLLADLFLRCPKSVQSGVDLTAVKDSDSNKEMCVTLFSQIRCELENKGFLREVKSLEVGRL